MRAVFSRFQLILFLYWQKGTRPYVLSHSVGEGRWSVSVLCVVSSSRNNDSRGL